MSTDAKVAWEGDSLDVVKAFPPAVGQEIGLDIRRLQQGTMPHDSRPMKSIGKGVFELRQRFSNRFELTERRSARIAGEKKDARKNN